MGGQALCQSERAGIRSGPKSKTRGRGDQVLRPRPTKGKLLPTKPDGGHGEPGWAIPRSFAAWHGRLLRSSFASPADLTDATRTPERWTSIQKVKTMSELKTCFKRVDYDLAGLLHYIDIGDIGLPDIQRPFVWSNAKVRDLFDSMYRGFPVGYLLFWENATNGWHEADRHGRQAAHDAVAPDRGRPAAAHLALRGVSRPQDLG